MNDKTNKASSLWGIKCFIGLLLLCMIVAIVCLVVSSNKEQQLMDVEIDFDELLKSLEDYNATSKLMVICQNDTSLNEVVESAFAVAIKDDKSQFMGVSQSDSEKYAVKVGDTHKYYPEDSQEYFEMYGDSYVKYQLAAIKDKLIMYISSGLFGVSLIEGGYLFTCLSPAEFLLERGEITEDGLLAISDVIGEISNLSVMFEIRATENVVEVVRFTTMIAGTDAVISNIDQYYFVEISEIIDEYVAAIYDSTEGLLEQELLEVIETVEEVE